MDKFAHEKARRADLVKKKGADPIWSGIRKGDEYLEALAARFPGGVPSVVKSAG